MISDGTGKKWEIGEPCTEEEFGVGSGSWSKSVLSKTKKLLGIETKGVVKISASGDLMCIDPNQAVTRIAGEAANAAANFAPSATESLLNRGNNIDSQIEAMSQ